MTPTNALDVLTEAREQTEVHYQQAVLLLRRATLHRREVNADAVAAIVVALRECADAIELATRTVTDSTAASVQGSTQLGGRHG
jgi:hypothetical protein